MKISGVYKITNTVTNDFYIGSSKNVKQRWTTHKSPSAWKKHPNIQMYQDMQKYGIDKFDFQILENVETEQLKDAEQEFIEIMKPTYNDRNANGWNIERYKEKYQKSDKHKYYNNQLCSYNGEILTLTALSKRFQRSGIEHSTKEAKKYIIPQNI